MATSTENAKLDERSPEKVFGGMLRIIVALLSPFLFLFDCLLNSLSDAYRWLLSFLIPGLGPFPLLLPDQRAGQHPAVVVTGSSRGIGRKIALDLAARGYVVFTTIRKKEHGEQLVRDCSQNHRARINGGAVRPVQIELSDRQSIERAVNDIRSALESEALPLAALVNNAGLIVIQELEAVRPEDYQASHSVNSLAPLVLTQHLLPQLKASGGRVVNVGSIAGFVLGPGFGQYCASKASLAAQTFVLRVELARYGVAVSLIEPGVIRTPAWDLGLSALVPFFNGTDDTGTAFAGGDNTGARLPTGHPLDFRARSLLHKVTAAMRLARMAAFPPDHVTHNVIHALTSPYPRPCYRVGWDAHLLGVLVPLVGWTWMELFLKAIF